MNTRDLSDREESFLVGLWDGVRYTEGVERPMAEEQRVALNQSRPEMKVAGAVLFYTMCGAGIEFVEYDPTMDMDPLSELRRMTHE